MEGIASWVDLFNSFMLHGTAHVTGNPALRIYFADAEAFAAYFLNHLTSGTDFDASGRESLSEAREELVRFLQKNLQSAAFDEARFGEFLKWVQVYGEMVSADFEE